MKKFLLILILIVVLLTACGGTPTLGAVAPPVGESVSPAPPEGRLAPQASPTPTNPPPSPTPFPYTAPDWFRDSSLYLIFVRSFADSNGDGIGDLNGIRTHLDYLQTLGVDTLWLMPIYPSPSQHGYDVTDYTAVNPQYGTLDDLRALVDDLHARGMHLILDFVPSHLSSDHPFFQDAYANPNSPYSDWFVWTNKAHTRYAGFAGSDAMPRFNHYNPAVVRYLSDAALFWLDLDGDGDYTDGVDGFRVDNATFPPAEFFYALRHAVKEVNPEALLLGEVWVESPADLGHFFENQFDALFDFPLYALLEGSQNFNADGLLAGKSSPALLNVLFQDEARAYHPEGIAVRFVGNHDTNRLASEVEGDPARERLAIAFLAALPGPPMIYYGDEIGMYGQKGGPPYWDNYRREPMDWYAADEGPGQTTWFLPPDRWNKPGDGISAEEEDTAPDSLLNFYRRALTLRREREPLRRGGMQPLSLTVSAPGPWGFVRGAGADAVVALFNFGDAPQEVTIPAFPFDASALTDVLHDERYPGAQVGQPYTLSLPAGGALWLVAAP
ncbi:MAG: alpha-amylase family glycosyl hydrolase [Anaerolineales bacterium]